MATWIVRVLITEDRLRNEPLVEPVSFQVECGSEPFAVGVCNTILNDWGLNGGVGGRYGGVVARFQTE
jgi:hypothetical protein